MIDFKNKILSEQIITYLGNKRKLIEFINSSVDKIISEDKILSKKRLSEITFFDIFAGSGIVSRYSKLKGFKTYSNDLELYSSVIQDSIIGTNLSEVDELFKPVYFNLIKNNFINADNNANRNNYYQKTLDYLNSLKQVKDDKHKYFQIHYAPANTENPDFEKERLFYTQENARKIDAIVEVIHNPDIFELKEPILIKDETFNENKNIFKEKFIYEKAKNIILSSLMYNMTWNINTSGTMKGFHNGWGGKGKNALSRIKGEMVLKPLPFIEGIKGITFNYYAEKVFDNNDLGEMDIIYADPPYNQHQYSANYNHLTTICKNDKYNPGPIEKGSRAGIRKDHTRSDFCKSVKNKDAIKEEEKLLKLAEKAFIDFIKNIKSKYIIMSYNNEGVVEIDRLIDLMSQNLKNTIKINYKVHDKFKGGKATQTSNKVMEYLIIIEQNKEQKREDFDIIKKDLLRITENCLFLDKYIDLEQFYENIVNSNNAFKLKKEASNKIISLLKNNKTVLKTNFYSLKVEMENLDLLNKQEIEEIKKYEKNNFELMEFYISNKYKTEAQKLLNVFKIKKYKDNLKDFKERIEKI